MDYDKLIFSLAVAGIGCYSVYLKDTAIAGMCLGIMGAILRPGLPKVTGDVSTTTVTKEVPRKEEAPNVPAP